MSKCVSGGGGGGGDHRGNVCDIIVCEKGFEIWISYLINFYLAIYPSIYVNMY